MSATLEGRRVLVIGRESGIARAITLAVRAAGRTVVVAGKATEKLAKAVDGAVDVVTRSLA
ncbi:MAG TPA: hypothetical protein VGM75_02805, partial [Pseudonocardiaceae bacterium]